MKKILLFLLVIAMVLPLSACNMEDLAGKLSDFAETLETEDENSEDTVSETEKPESPQTSATEFDDEYDPSAWIKDNLSISFYFAYFEDSDSNELVTLKVCDGKGAMFSKIGEGDTRPTNVYEETEDGLVQIMLMEMGESKIAYQSLPVADRNFETTFPNVMLIAGTFGCRIDSDPLRGLEEAGTENYIGRKCRVYENVTPASKSTVLIDEETGIVLKSIVETNVSGESTTYYSILVTEFEYGKVSESDVAIDLSAYEMTYETAE